LDWEIEPVCRFPLGDPNPVNHVNPVKMSSLTTALTGGNDRGGDAAVVILLLPVVILRRID
jgi:hypothetical protein